MRKLHIDFEGRSQVDLKVTGVRKYCNSGTTEVLCMAYKFDAHQTKIWFPSQPFPQEIIDYVRDGGMVCAHNALFEVYFWNLVLTRYVPDLPELKIENTNCTMLRALCYGLPASLDSLGKALHITDKKDKEGSALMLKMCKPRKAKKNEDPNVVYWVEDSTSLERLGDYCIRDVDAEYEIDNLIPELSDFDCKVRIMDFEMQERGIPIDVELTNSLNEIYGEYKKVLTDEMQAISKNSITTIRQNKEIMKFINENFGTNIKSLSKENIDGVLESLKDIPVAYRIVQIYSLGNKSSLAKLNAILDNVDLDNRSHGCLNLNGTFTGRWVGRMWQPQNIKRIDEETQGRFARLCVKNALSDKSLQDKFMFTKIINKNVCDLLSTCLRSCISAVEGKTLIGADYSNIEGRIMAWLAGSDAKIEAFKSRDAGTGDDMYKVAFANSFGMNPKDVTKQQRQIGKVQELSLQYQGGISALVGQLKGFKIKASDVASVALNSCSQEDYDSSAWYYDKAENRYDLSREDFIGLHIVIQKWRKSVMNAPIKQFWDDIENSFKKAYFNPGFTIVVDKRKLITYKYDGKVLTCKLPTGKLLCYHNVSVDASGKIKHKTVNDRGQFTEQGLYGGLLSNHIVQGTGAEIMKIGMMNLYNSGYGLILTVHDEAVAELPYSVSEDSDKGKELLEDFEAKMVDIGEVFNGLPIVCEGWIDQRYVK